MMWGVGSGRKEYSRKRVGICRGPEAPRGLLGVGPRRKGSLCKEVAGELGRAALQELVGHNQDSGLYLERNKESLKDGRQRSEMTG